MPRVGEDTFEMYLRYRYMNGLYLLYLSILYLRYSKTLSMPYPAVARHLH